MTVISELVEKSRRLFAGRTPLSEEINREVQAVTARIRDASSELEQLRGSIGTQLADGASPAALSESQRSLEIEIEQLGELAKVLRKRLKDAQRSEAVDNAPKRIQAVSAAAAHLEETERRCAEMLANARGDLYQARVNWNAGMLAGAEVESSFPDPGDELSDLVDRLLAAPHQVGGKLDRQLHRPPKRSGRPPIPAGGGDFHWIEGQWVDRSKMTRRR